MEQMSARIGRTHPQNHNKTQGRSTEEKRIALNCFGQLIVTRNSAPLTT